MVSAFLDLGGWVAKGETREPPIPPPGSLSQALHRIRAGARGERLEPELEAKIFEPLFSDLRAHLVTCRPAHALYVLNTPQTTTKLTPKFGQNHSFVSFSEL